MDLYSLLQANSHIKLEVTGDDLLQFADRLVADVREWARQEDAVKQTDETYLNTQQVCDMLNVCATTLWTWDKAGYLRPSKVGKKKRYALSDVQRILKERGGATSGKAAYDQHGNFVLPQGRQGLPDCPPDNLSEPKKA